jgi:hypothetical protein
MLGASSTAGGKAMNRNFSQTIKVHCREPAKLVELIARWDRNQAAAEIMGYMGTRVLADREHPDEYLIIAEFGVIDPSVSAAEEAARNNERPETQAIAATVTELVDGVPEFHNFDVVYRTDG